MVVLANVDPSFEFEWGFYVLSASEAIFRARTYNCITYSVRCSSEVFRAGSTLVDYVDEPIFV